MPILIKPSVIALKIAASPLLLAMTNHYPLNRHGHCERSAAISYLMIMILIYRQIEEKTKYHLLKYFIRCCSVHPAPIIRPKAGQALYNWVISMLPIKPEKFYVWGPASLRVEIMEGHAQS